MGLHRENKFDDGGFIGFILFAFLAIPMFLALMTFFVWLVL